MSDDVFYRISMTMNVDPAEIAKIVHNYIERDIGCNYDIFNSPPPPIPIRPVKIKTLKERLEEKKMKATSVQNIKNVRNISFLIENHPMEMESKLTIVASTDDDIFEFGFEGSDLLEICKAAGLFTGWEKDQKIRELEKDNKKLKALNDDLEQERESLLEENDKLRYSFDDLSEENKKLRKRIDTLKGRKKSTSEEVIKTDNVNHPSHYTGKYECIDVMQDVFGNEATNDFCLCNAFKYIWRARKKNGLEDVKKAVWYLNKYIEEAEDGEDKVTGT